MARGLKIVLPLGVIAVVMVVVIAALVNPSESLERGHWEFYSINIERAVDYVKSRYNPSLRLVAEAQGPGGWEFPSPCGGDTKFWTMDKVYWLGDNALAALALRPHDSAMSEAIERRVKSFGEFARDDKPDLLAGRRIPATPWIKNIVTLEQGDDFIIVGSEFSEGILYPIEAYANVSINHSILAWRSGDEELSRKIFHQVLDTWDGKGVWDGPSEADQGYAVYKLAMLLIALQVTQEPFEDYDKIERRMWQNQNSSGGIVTGIGLKGFPAGGPNIETTSLALLVYDAELIAELRKRFKQRSDEPGPEYIGC